ncbi:peroxidase [Corynebacterium riegelii]|nr:peroxidase [Corynebacterium riegelii]
MAVSRRGFLAGGVVVASASMATACGDTDAPAGVPSNSEPNDQPLKKSTVPFDGPHQAGISTPTQASLNMIGFNLREGVEAKGIRNLMRLWTEDAREMAAGRNPLGSLEPEMLEWPANLTFTVGFGERVFDIAAPEKKPSWLHPIPDMQHDQLREEWGQTDLVLQICADDPVMCAWAMRHMVRASVDYVDIGWVQQGFANAYGAIPKGQTPRNLFGQIDGTVNPYSEEEYAEQVFADDGSTSMVIRRIEMDLDDWEKLDRVSREESVGRTLDDGAPLSGGDEFTPADFEKIDDFGLRVIDPNSHMARAAAPADHPEQKFKRRPYNYYLPPEAGLIFVAFQKDPDIQFTPVQQRLDEIDRLNEWTTAIGSAVYWIAPGTDPESADRAYWGQSVLS